MENCKVAYICTGTNPKCSEKPWCFKCALPMPDNNIVCHHTTDTEYAATPLTDDPEKETPERFKRFVVGEHEIRYFEDPESEYS